jgi:hypothetical protein
MIDRNTLQRPTAGNCCRCQHFLEGDDIFHWSPGSWSVWCFKCYKAEHFHNLVRLQQRSEDRRGV